MKQEDRDRLVRALHDGVGQTLTALALQMEWIATRVGDPDLAARLQKLAGAARESLEDVRRVSQELKGAPAHGGQHK